MPVFFLIVACALWGVSFPVMKALHAEQALRMRGVRSEFLAAWMQVARFGLGALLLLPVLRHGLPRRNEVRQGLVVGFWGGLGMALQADGLAYTEASTSAFLTQAYCVILPLWACLRDRTRPGMRVVGATLLVVVGGGILSGVRPGQLALGRGETETLLGAALFTFQILTLENPRYHGNRGGAVTLVMCAAIAIIFLPVAWILAPGTDAVVVAGASWPAFTLVAVLALFCSVGAYGLMNVWQPRVPATEAGLIYTIEPVFTAGYAMFLPAILGRFTGTLYPDERLTWALVSGGALILGANVLMQWRKPPHDPSIAPAP